MNFLGITPRATRKEQSYSTNPFYEANSLNIIPSTWLFSTKVKLALFEERRKGILYLMVEEVNWNSKSEDTKVYTK
jgi:hypothetical protein